MFRQNTISLFIKNLGKLISNVKSLVGKLSMVCKQPSSPLIGKRGESMCV